MSDLDPLLDRRQYLLGPNPGWNGIDYVEIANEAETTFRVHFLNSVPVKGSLGQLPGSPPPSPVSASAAVSVTGGEVITTITLLPIDESTAWSADSEARPVLTVGVVAPGDFSTYTLSVESAVLDPFFASVLFSFKANCPSDLDCAAPTPPCPPATPVTVPIDYLAKDFSSFVQALSDFSSQRYPAWLERSEADVGMVVMEALSAIGDELSYYQDRVAGESQLFTATQPVSIARLARLVDYEPMPATVATALVQLEVTPGTTAITEPVRCQAIAADQTTIDFEVGDGLAAADGTLSTFAYPVDARWNRFGPSGEPGLVPYWWDGTKVCLSAGATQLDVIGWGFGLVRALQLLIDTAGPTSADPPVRELLTLGAAPLELSDPVFGVELTRLFFAAPTTLDHDLTRTVLAGNLVPVTQGLRTSETFYLPACATAPLVSGEGVPAVLRVGANWTPTATTPDYRYPLSSGPLAFIATSETDADSPLAAIPEIVLEQQSPSGALAWVWVRWLLDASPADAAFTLSPQLYSPVLTTDGVTYYDYDGGGGTVILFGNGEFGQLPAAGTAFNATYRIGGGAAGNAPADTIVRVIDPGSSGVTACTNPFAAAGGADAETAQQVCDAAPQAFQQPLRVVRPSDYEAAAESLSWVQQAGTTFRWTGSWLTVLTAANPIATEQPTIAEVEQLTDLLNRRRLAGYESYVLPPRYVSVDLCITLCADPSFFASDVESAVLAALQPGAGLPGGPVGFFDHSNWSFGQPLESSALLAAIQVVPGVQGVSCVQYRERGVQATYTALPETLTVAPDQLLRVDNDPSRPDDGSLSVTVEGAK